LDGSPCESTATITIFPETTCHIGWTTGNATSTGNCMRYGPTFSAAYVLGDHIGLVIYQIMEDCTLDGQLDHLRTGRCRDRSPYPDVSLNGTGRIAPSGANPSGTDSCRGKSGRDCLLERRGRSADKAGKLMAVVNNTPSDASLSQRARATAKKSGSPKLFRMSA